MASPGAPPSELSELSVEAGELAGLLADGDRRAVVAAIVLGAGDLAAVVDTTGLTTRKAVVALQRLQSGGLVAELGGRLELDTAAIAAAARRPAPVGAEGGAGGDGGAGGAGGDGGQEASDKVLRTFVKDGRLVSIPAAHGKRLVILEWLAQRFEPGVRYRETMVNLLLGTAHADVAALRRYLVDEGYLDRADGEYWRSGGAVDV